MRRRAFGIAVSTVVLVLGIAGPASADTFPDNGTFDFGFLSVGECSRTSCSFTDVNVSVNVQTGAGEVCVGIEERRSFDFGCGPVEPGAFSMDATGATLAPTTVFFERCNRQGCTTEEAVVSAEWTIVGDFSSYSSRSRDEFDGCVFRSSVRGERAPAEGSFTIDDTEYTFAFGEVGTETRSFTETCR